MKEGLYKSIIQGLSQNHFQKIFVLAGAGISVAAGIPGKIKILIIFFFKILEAQMEFTLLYQKNLTFRILNLFLILGGFNMILQGFMLFVKCIMKSIHISQRQRISLLRSLMIKRCYHLSLHKILTTLKNNAEYQLKKSLNAMAQWT